MRGRDGRVDRNVDERRVMSATNSGCGSVGSGRGNGDNEGLGSASRTGETTSGVVSTRVGRNESASTVSSGVDGVQGTSRY